MKKDTYSKLDRLFEKARNKPIDMSVEEIHQLLDSRADDKGYTQGGESLGKRQSVIRMPAWSIAAAASILMLIGTFCVMIENPSTYYSQLGHQNTPADTGIQDHMTFSLIDTHEVDELSFWDTSKTSLRRMDPKETSKQCIEAHQTSHDCEMLITLAFDQPDECSLVLIDTLGTIVKRLLQIQIQEASLYSYYIDLCHISTGTYDLVLRTRSGSTCKEKILLN